MIVNGAQGHPGRTDADGCHAGAESYHCPDEIIESGGGNMSMFADALADPVTQVIAFVIVVLFFVGLFCQPLRESAPGLLTSLGIFGTFLGTFIALSGFDPSSDMSDSVNNLLGGMKIAFATSLVGILASIIFKVIASFRFKEDELTESEVVYPMETVRLLNEIKEHLAVINSGQLESIRKALVGDETEYTLLGQHAHELKRLESIEVMMENTRDLIGEEDDWGLHNLIRELAEMRWALIGVERSSKNSDEDAGHNIYDVLEKLVKSQSELLEKNNTRLDNQSNFIDDQRKLLESLTELRRWLIESQHQYTDALDKIALQSHQKDSVDTQDKSVDLLNEIRRVNLLLSKFDAKKINSLVESVDKLIHLQSSAHQPKKGGATLEDMRDIIKEQLAQVGQTTGNKQNGGNEKKD
ncbi:MAG: MotA/TolQ/ExbB proton channel family protein [Gammaproteobacteria bacterium]|nr:MotA/TolQ/ExbB proton channel family protein [Gammaproteobacteria bacterium]